MTTARGKRAAILAAAWAAAGCEQQGLFRDQRPPTLPAPVDVRQEQRDARYFLALPDESFLPAAGFRPGIGSGVSNPH